MVLVFYFGEAASRRSGHDAPRILADSTNLRSGGWQFNLMLPLGEYAFLCTLLVNSACLIRRECIAALGGYATQPRRNEGVDFYCRAIRRFGFDTADHLTSF
jgi:hypothetical protein